MPSIILAVEGGGNKLVEELNARGVWAKKLSLYGLDIVVSSLTRELGKSVLLKYKELVRDVITIDNPYILASKEWRDKTVIEVKGFEIGSDRLLVIAGPCAVEGEEDLRVIAEALKKLGIPALRGGAFKPRTSPYSFQGLGVEGLKMLRRVADEYGLIVVSEVLDPRDVPLVSEYIDILQVGARNCQNYPLLREVGRQRRPVLLKRGFGQTIEEFLSSSEYILLEGNGDIILVERGIRTFEHATRFTLDIAAIPILKRKTHLPVIVDVSHPAGIREIVPQLALASIASGADGVMIEVHVNPEKALSDSRQQLQIKDLPKLVRMMKRVAKAVSRRL